LKKNEQNIIIYYFTGISKGKITIKALDTRMDGYLKKSFDLSDFNDILAKLNQKAII